MITISEISDYLAHIRQELPAITITELAIDDVQINQVVTEVKESDLVLLALAPSHHPEGTDNDNALDRDLMCFLLLKKSDRKIKRTEFWSRMSATQEIVKQLRYLMLNDVEEYNGGCSFMSRLEITGLKIDPVFNLSGTDGYEINFFLKSSL